VTTSARKAVLLILAATAVIYAGLALPLQKKAAAAAEAYRRARDERREARSRLGEVERRESALRRSAPVWGEAATLGDPVARTRHGVVLALESSGLSGVRLAVRPGSPPAAALVRLAAEGPFADVVQLTAALVRPGTGLVLERYQLSETDTRVAVRFEGIGLEAAR